MNSLIKNTISGVLAGLQPERSNTTSPFTQYSVPSASLIFWTARQHTLFTQHSVCSTHSDTPKPSLLPRLPLTLCHHPTRTATASANQQPTASAADNLLHCHASFILPPLLHLKVLHQTNEPFHPHPFPQHLNKISKRALFSFYIGILC